VDLSKLRPGDWLLVAGGVAMLIFGLALDWAKVDLGGVSASGNNAFDYFFTGGIAWILVVAAAVIAVLLAIGAIVPGTTPWSLILLLMTGFATDLGRRRRGRYRPRPRRRDVGRVHRCRDRLRGGSDELHPVRREVLGPDRHGEDARGLQGRKDRVDTTAAAGFASSSPAAVTLGCGLLPLQIG
jgi:hypothetical protein